MKTTVPALPSGPESVISARELVIQAAEILEAATSASTGPLATHLSTGFEELDAMTQGLQRGSLVVLAGSVGMGKTSLALNLARNVALMGDMAVHYCSLDSPPSALLRRILASMCEVESGRIQFSRVANEEWPRLGEAMARISAAPLFFSNAQVGSINAMRNRSYEVVELSRKQLGLLIIDSLQLVKGNTEEVLPELRRLALELNACVVVTCQSKPTAELRTGGLPQLNDLPALDAMQAYPHVISILHREEYWRPASDCRGSAQLMLFKNTNNPVGSISLNFEPQFSRFIG